MEAEVSCVGLGEREHDEEQRHTDAVVEAALDVQPLADARRQSLVRDHGGIRGGQDHSKDKRLGQIQSAEAGGGESRSQEDVSGSPIPSSRRGSVYSVRSRRRSRRDASEKSTSVRVASASSFTVSLDGERSIQPPAHPNQARGPH